MSIPKWSHALKIGDLLTEDKTGVKYEVKDRLTMGSYFSPNSMPYAIPHYTFTIVEYQGSRSYHLTYSDDILEEYFTPVIYRETPLYKKLQGE